MVALFTEFAHVLRAHQSLATGTIGRRIRERIGVDVEGVLSEPLEGNVQIRAPLATGAVVRHDPLAGE